MIALIDRPSMTPIRLRTPSGGEAMLISTEQFDMLRQMEARYYEMRRAEQSREIRDLAEAARRDAEERRKDAD